MAITERYVTADAGGAGDGSAGNPWTLTQARGSAAAGDRINVKKGTYTRTASDTFANDGTAVSPIIWRGYNETIGDLDNVGRTNGTQALITTDFPVIAFNATYGLVGTGMAYNLWQCIRITGEINGDLVSLSTASTLMSCSVENASTGASAVAVNLLSTGAGSINSDVSLTGASGGLRAISMGAGGTVCYGNRIKSQADGIAAVGNIQIGGIIANQFIDVGGKAIDLSSVTTAANRVICCLNTIYSAGSDGILGRNSAVSVPDIYCDNHITDCGGFAFNSPYKATAEIMGIFANNRTRDNTSGAQDGYDDWFASTMNHITTDAGDATSDYESTTGGSENLALVSGAAGRNKAIGNRDIGALQHADPEGGGGGAIVMQGLGQIGSGVY